MLDVISYKHMYAYKLAKRDCQLKNSTDTVAHSVSCNNSLSNIACPVPLLSPIVDTPAN